MPISAAAHARQGLAPWRSLRSATGRLLTRELAAPQLPAGPSSTFRKALATQAFSLPVSYHPRLALGQHWASDRLLCGLHRPLVRTLATEATHRSLVTPDEQQKYAFLDTTSEFPRFDQLNPADIKPALDLLLTRIDKEFSQREKMLSPTWAGTFGQVEDLTMALEKAFGLVVHLHNVRNSPEVRAALQATQPRVVEINLRIQQSSALYDALTQLRQNLTEFEALTAVQQRVLDKQILAMRLSGVSLQPGSASHRRFTEIAQRLSHLSNTFSNHVLDATKAFQLLVTEKQRLNGCSTQLLSLLARNAQSRGHPEATADHGPWVVTLDFPVYGPFMQTCADRELRHQAYQAFITRASQGEVDNTAPMQEILQLRQESAQLLGYASYAELSLQSKMAPSVDAVNQLLETLHAAAWPCARREHATLTQFAHDHLALEGPIQPWDLGYVGEQCKKQQLQFTDDQVAQYFPFPKVLQGMFSLVEQLFAVRVEEVHQVDTLTPSTWNAEVKLFRVQDANSGQALAYFYGDFYSRTAEKNGGAWADICTTRHFDPHSQSHRVPIAYLVCNQTAPLPGEPSLMKFRDVLTLFHEFGHCLQHMLTTVNEPQASGLNGIEWDFVEVASQFMENFCYEPQWLALIAEHYQTKEPMPPAMVKALQHERTFLQGLATLRQLHFGMVDMALHQNYSRTTSSAATQSPFDVDQRIAERTSLVPRDPNNRALCSFSHIFAGGYAAGYYSYKWSEVYSADAYAAVTQATTAAPATTARNPANTTDMCQRYRDTVLSLGGGTAPGDIWQQFVGRPHADVSALICQSGLA
ncbi:hypothetical protein H4R35_001417 [Dimargaris xerosporica]|nr:hypothetical protein H4R35_001417 [Dimargaris xerosporica]